MDYIVDVCIPTYNEKGYIEDTLYALSLQTLYKKGRMHIVVADFKDELNKDDKHLEELCKKYKHVSYITVDRKGIAYARNIAILKGAKSDVFMMFDADSQFNRLDAVEIMIRPILDEGLKITNCECILYDFKQNKVVNHPVTNFYAFAANIGSELEKYFFARGPGLTISRDAYLQVGGFRDVDVAEDYWMAVDVCLYYSIHAKRFMKEVKVLTSDRRSQKFDLHGLDIFNYSKNSFR